MIASLVGQVIGAVVGSFVAAVFVRIATRWSAKYTPEYWDAYKAALIGNLAFVVTAMVVSPVWRATVGGNGVLTFVFLLVVAVVANGVVFGVVLVHPASGSIGIGRGFAVVGYQFVLMGAIVGIVVLLGVIAAVIMDVSSGTSLI